MTDINARIKELADIASDAMAKCDRAGLTAIARALYAEVMKDAAEVARDYLAKADGKFDSVVKSHQRGQRNLELAAIASAGMSHAARNIATALEAKAQEASNG